MPTLQITRDGLRSEHAAATLNYLYAIMFWPRECDERSEFLRTCTALWRAEQRLAVPGLSPEPGLDIELADVLPVRILTPIVRERLIHGQRVGLEFAAAVGRGTWASPGQPVSIKALRAEMAQEPAIAVGVKQIEKDALEYRTVAHLWAALHITHAEGLHPPGYLADWLAEFLSLSEWVRHQALKVMTQKGTALLAADVDSWRPPAWLTLPAVSLVAGLPLEG